MSWIDAISDIVSRYSGSAGGAAVAPDDPHQDFCRVAKTAPTQVTADALAHAFRSDRNSSFPEMVASMFRESNPEQRAGLLNQLISSMGPAALASIPGLTQFSGSFGQPAVTPEQARQISPEQVQQAAEHAQNGNPSIIDQVSTFYAAHPNVVKGLGAAAITIALQHLSRNR